ncbi:MAG: hypothetical protein HYV27_10540 [Candidatus Hydrogenedentes bacterium]|nr:hypothetical protein [Candidatus Hydrogenedentota bacterium]
MRAIYPLIARLLGVLFLLWSLWLIGTGQFLPIFITKQHLMLSFFGGALFAAGAGLAAFAAARHRRRKGRGTAVHHAIALAGGALTGICTLLFLFELTFFTLNRWDTSGPVWAGNPHDFRGSPLLGYEGPPGVVLHGRCTVRDELIYDVHYTFDEAGRRRTPFDAARAQEAWLFFGCSFTYGEGVEDDETLPACIARANPEWAVYNYALGGYGPGQMLARLEEMNWKKDVPQPLAGAVYVYTPFQVRRASGSMSIVSNWGRHFPCYELQEDNTVRRIGSFESAWPWRASVYGFLSKEEAVRRFHLDWPLVSTARDFQLTAGIIHQAARRLQEDAPGVPFYVVLYPHNPVAETSSAALLPHLDQNLVKVIDCSGLWPGDPTDDGYYYRGEHHPTPKAHEELAAAILSKITY